MEITVLGTGHATVTECYNTCFTLSKNDEFFLVDAGGGNGILRQLKYTNIYAQNIKAMFISHIHTDHIMGAIWIIRVIGRKYLVEDYDTPFVVYGNKQVLNAIRQMCDVLLPYYSHLFDDKIKLIEVDTGDTKNILGNKVDFFDINAKKVKQTGFSMWLNENEKFTFIGDEVCSESTEKYVESSKWLFADAYMAGKEAEEYDPIKKHHHSTVKFIASLAQNLNVKNLVLSHTVDTNLEKRKEEFTQDAKKYFKGNVFVPNDLEKFDIV